MKVTMREIKHYQSEDYFEDYFDKLKIILIKLKHLKGIINNLKKSRTGT